MGGALLKGWIANGTGPLIVVEPKPGPELRKWAKASLLTLLKDLSQLPSTQVAACIVALKPQILKDAAPTLRAIAETGAVMISIAAGTTCKSLSRAWGGKARIIRSMPNTPGAIGQGITAIYAMPQASRKDRQLADRLLSALGQTVWLETETLIDAATAVSGSGPAYVFYLVEALTQAGIKQGLPPSVAAQLARQTIIGAGALMDSEKTDPATLRQNVTSPGGTTAAALNILMGKSGLSPLMAKAVQAARKRARQLGS